jgi:IstB-like ATP binding protein
VKTANCITCSEPFDYQPHIICGREFFTPTYCEKCVGEHLRTQARIEQQQQADDVARKWERICPPIYRDTDSNRLTPGMRKYAETWTSENGRGLAFVGSTGKCKTRVCYMILARYHFEGHGVFGITAAKLAELVQNKFSIDNEIRGASLEKLRLIEKAPLLLLDDVGQEKITERTGSEFFSLIEQRTSWKRPTLWTSNLDAGTFKQALGAERGQPTIRRLREFSEIVKV